LISSTVLSRIVTPAMYLLVVRGAEKNGKAAKGDVIEDGVEPDAT